MHIRIIINALLGLIMSLFFYSQFCFGSEPTHKDIEYSQQNARCKLDVWLPKGTKTPCPMVVFFHGGGFTGGDKSAFRHHQILRKYLDKDIAFASVNYPLLRKVDPGNFITQAADYLDIMAKAAESIRFLKTKSKEWNVDSARIAVMGISAGAMISEYLAYWEDLGINGCFVQEQPHHSLYLLAAVNTGHPPLILYTRSGKNDNVHNPEYARKFKTYFDKVGVKCELYGSKASGLPQLPAGVAIEDRAMQLFSEQWKDRDSTNNTIKHNKPDAGDGK